MLGGNRSHSRRSQRTSSTRSSWPAWLLRSTDSASWKQLISADLPFRNTNDMMLATLYRYHAALLAPSSPIRTKESKAAGLGIFLRTDGRKAAAKQGMPLLEEHLWNPVRIDQQGRDRRTQERRLSIFAGSSPNNKEEEQRNNISQRKNGSEGVCGVRPFEPGQPRL